jgi:2-polyprenyl-6-methoxyphenol hydroxylase-like FAD-dependent oxidoreductase
MMKTEYLPIRVIGGGLAGLTLGIALRNRNVPVVVCEAGRYPRHRVCGEFISGRGIEVLHRLGLWDMLVAHGGLQEVRTVAFHADDVKGATVSLPHIAWSISRYDLDALLADELVARGGELMTGHRERATSGKGVVLATGRNPGRESSAYRLLGFKVHARGVDLTSDLEMHHTDNSYVGLCRLSHGRVNICGLVKTRRPVSDLRSNWNQWVLQQGGRRLQQQLMSAELDPDSFCVVAGLSYLEPESLQSDGLVIGDAMHKIPPITGNGMSMAIESAELAALCLTDYSSGAQTWDETQKRLRTGLSNAFQRRLFWAGKLQRFLLGSRSQWSVRMMVRASGWLARPLFHLTR